MPVKVSNDVVLKTAYPIQTVTKIWDRSYGQSLTAVTYFHILNFNFKFVLYYVVTLSLDYLKKTKAESELSAKSHLHNACNGLIRLKNR